MERAVATDPIQVEVIRHAFLGVAEEMKIVLARTAHNPIIYEVLDFSCGLFDRECRTISQADGLPMFLGNLSAAVRCLVADVGRDALRAGDVYLFNDPYAQGTHVNDVTTIAPAFDGDELIGFACTRAHWLDIGGKDPGGSIDCTDVVQEGLWLRSIRLYNAGQLDTSVWRLLEHNIRTAPRMLGDLRAQVAASRTGVEGFAAVFARHGARATDVAVAEIMRQGEQRARAAIGAMREGVYEAEGCLDDDCIGNGPLEIRVRVTVGGGEIEIDLTGSSPQNPGPVNAPYAATLCACRIALKAMTNPHIPATEGDFQPLRLIVPAGSMFDARYPAPTFMYHTHLIVLIDLIVKALAQADPSKAIAGHYGNLFGFILVGDDPDTGEMYIQQEPEYGGWGARSDGDGESALIFVINGDCRVIPAEVIEGRFPLRLERYELRVDSGGPGRWRGGLGTIRDFRVLDHDANMTVITDRSICPPWGLDGGLPAQPCQALVTANGHTSVHAKARYAPVLPDTLISLRTGGGGGYGDPQDRPAEDVRADVVRGYVSRQSAAEHYGVSIDADTLEIDARETEQLRAPASADR